MLRHSATGRESEMSELSGIESEIAALPPNLRAEVLDFVKFIKQRHGLPALHAAVDKGPETGDSAFFQALQQIGFVGCIESDDQLASTYKTRLDFSAKAGTQP